MVAKKIIAIFLIIVIVSGCLQQGNGGSGSIDTQPKLKNTSLPDLISELKKNVVHITYSVDHDYDLWGYDEDEFIGSGVIYSINGNEVYVLTNRHVVDLNFPDYIAQVNDEEIILKTFSGDRFYATSRLIAPGNIDLAIVRFSKGVQNISASSIMDTTPPVGEEVLVIGMPEELEWSVSKGIVSGIRYFDPDGVILGDKYTAIQTDAAINSGNSGGGMFTTDGRLVGINTMKYSGFGVEGLNFAISSVEFLKLKDRFTDFPLITPLSRPAGGSPSSIGLMHVTYDSEYEESGQFEISFYLVDNAGAYLDAEGSGRLAIVDDNQNVIYNKSFSIDSGNYTKNSGYPFYGKEVATLVIPYSEVNTSESAYGDFMLEFTTNGTTFSKISYDYLPYAIMEEGSGGYSDYYDDYYYGDDYYSDYSSEPYLKDIGAKASSGGILVNLSQGGLDDYYGSLYVLKMEFTNTESTKKEIKIKDATLVTAGEQYDADFYYYDEEVGKVYPNASVKKTLEFYDIDYLGSDAILYLELRVIEDDSVESVDMQINFKP